MSASSHSGSIGGSILSSVVTGLVVSIPDGVLGYAEKLLSVFVLAMVAELGRRLITSLFGKGSKP